MNKEEINKIASKKVSIRTVFICIIIFFIVVGLCFCCFLFGSNINKNGLRGETIGTVFRDIVEHATQEADVKGVYTIPEDRKLFGISIPFTESVEVLVAPVKIKAGYKKDDIKYNFDFINKKIVVKIPEAQILDKYLITEKCYDLYTHDNPFSNISTSKYRETENKIIEECEREALDNGLLVKARENAANMVRDTKSCFDPENEYQLEIENAI